MRRLLFGILVLLLVLSLNSCGDDIGINKVEGFFCDQEAVDLIEGIGYGDDIENFSERLKRLLEDGFDSSDSQSSLYLLKQRNENHIPSEWWEESNLEDRWCYSYNMSVDPDGKVFILYDEQLGLHLIAP